MIIYRIFVNGTPTSCIFRSMLEATLFAIGTLGQYRTDVRLEALK